MIEIIKNGNRAKFKVECRECGCIFKFEERDIIHGSYLHSFHDIITCPCCGLLIELTPSRNSYICED